MANVGIDIATVMIPAAAKKLTSSPLSVQEEHLVNMASGAIVDTAFPAVSLVPKTETGVLNFLQKYPDFDGRDTIIAIFDSGVDPKASGLETICDGSVKVIERFDCSGCGDTDTSKKVTADSKGCIIGASGCPLKLTPAMVSANTANGEYRVGMKVISDLYPSKVRDTAVANLKLKEWDKPHKTVTADVVRQLSLFETQNSDSSKLPWDKKLEKENLDNSLEVLNNFEKLYTDVRTAYDIVAYPTENGWQAVIDVTLKGDLENAIHIGEYTKTHEVKNLDEYLSVSMNIHDEGNVVEFVGMCSSHGTHVSSIASGNHDSKDVNGVAPNAKIVSLTIGDGRLGSMETGTSLVRAMIKVMELCEAGTKVDVINMSYGEHAAWSNSGRICELMSEVVNKYGVVWVASAGNHGPALSTIGTPPDISQPSCIGVGAYVSPQMMEAEYALREKLPGNVYTWTSRDPCIDGGRGVTVCAPGAAITSVPQFTMCKSQLMNGTSMAAPHVAGAIALLVSGLKQKGVQYSPFSIKRAICATATKLNYVDPFAQGSGLLNVEKAFEYLLQYRDAAENLLRFSVRVGPQNAKGIHLRAGVLKKPYEYNVTIEPEFLNHKEADPKAKFNFNVRLNLISSQPFVQCGSFLDLYYGARALNVKVDPASLPPGVHTATINAYDSSAVEKGPLFEIPVTVVQPHILNTEQSRVFEPAAPIEFQPNTIQRDFILVPEHATWAVLKMRSTDANRDKEVGKFFVHTMQLLPISSCRKLETMKILNVTGENETTWPFKVEANNILELCIAKYWSNFGNTHVKYSLEFHGISTCPRATVMSAAIGIHRFEVTALNTEEFQPSIQLKSAAVVLKPNESKITALSPTRDVIPAGRQIYQNILTYNFTIAKAQEVTFFAPLFNSFLYESEFESQLWMIFDTNKLISGCGDARSHKFCNKFEKGDYIIRLQVRHEKKEALEKISEATMVALFKLSSPITMEIYDHYNQCIVAGRKFSSCVLKQVPKVVYVAPLNNEKLTKAALPAGTAWLSGVMTLAKDEVGRRAHVLKFQYNLNDSSALSSGSSGKKANGTSNTNATSASSANTNGGGGGGGNGNNGSASKSAGGSASPKKPAKSGKDDYAEALRDFQCSMIPKIDLEKAEELCNTVLAAHPKHFTAILMYIQNLESTHLKQQLPYTFAKYVKGEDAESKPDLTGLTSALNTIIEKTDIIIKDTDKDALLAYYGIKNDTRPDAAKIKTNMEKQKNNLLEALSKKGIALTKLNVMENGTQKAARLEEIDGVFTEIGKFTDTTDSKVNNFILWHAYAHEHHGRLARNLMKTYDEKHNREVYEELALALGAAKWDHIQEIVDRSIVSSNPISYRPF